MVLYYFIHNLLQSAKLTPFPTAEQDIDCTYRVLSFQCDRYVEYNFIHYLLQLAS